MKSERNFWLEVHKEPDYKRQYIADTDVVVSVTLDAIIPAIRPYVPAEGGRILEIGCGYGRLTKEVKRQFPTASVYGTDVNPRLLMEAEIYTDQPGHFYYCTDSLVDLPVQDAIYSVAVFQHLPSIEKNYYIKQAYAALKPGGAFRLQFVAGNRDNFLDHWEQTDTVVGWLKAAGFKVMQPIDKWLVNRQWVWITAVKE